MLVTSIVVIGWNLNPLWCWCSATVANGLTLLVCLRSLFIVAPMQLKNSLSAFAISIAVVTVLPVVCIYCMCFVGLCLLVNAFITVHLLLGLLALMIALQYCFFACRILDTT